jgi:hypothetical protein
MSDADEKPKRLKPQIIGGSIVTIPVIRKPRPVRKSSKKVSKFVDESKDEVKAVARLAQGLLAKPDYMEYDNHGSIKAIFCKVCGAQIAGQFVDDMRIQRFRRFANYGEVKMSFKGGTHHISNGCHDDIKRAMAPNVPLLQAMYEADIPLAMPYEANNPRTVLGVVGFTLEAKGLL